LPIGTTHPVLPGKAIPRIRPMIIEMTTIAEKPMFVFFLTKYIATKIAIVINKTTGCKRLNSISSFLLSYYYIRTPAAKSPATGFRNPALR
jgi:hypothetical protein